MHTLLIRIPGSMRGKGAVRFDPRTRRTYNNEKTVSAANWIKSCAADQVGQPCVEAAVAIEIIVGVAVPKSWSKLKQRLALSGELRPTSRPDVSNMLKLVEDAFKGIVWKDDAQVHDAHIVKRYAEIPEAVVTVTISEPAGPRLPGVA